MNLITNDAPAPTKVIEIARVTKEASNVVQEEANQDQDAVSY